MATNNANVINLWIGTDELLELLDVVITYESVARGLTRGHAAYELVLKAAHVETYPDKMRERFEDASRSRSARAASESLAAPRRSSRVA